MSQPLLTQLTEALRVLPGVGERSAQRMAFYLLQRERDGGRRLAEVLEQAMRRIRQCNRCRTYTEGQICQRCSDPEIDQNTLCLVETPADALAIERSTGYRGLFFILHGRLSPIDGIGREQLGLPLLQKRAAAEPISEVVLALGSSVESEATIHLVREVLPESIRVTRIAHGVPVGGDIEYIDGSTLSHAFAGRQALDSQ